MVISFQIPDSVSNRVRCVAIYTLQVPLKISQAPYRLETGVSAMIALINNLLSSVVPGGNNSGKEYN